MCTSMKEPGHNNYVYSCKKMRKLHPPPVSSLACALGSPAGQTNRMWPAHPDLLAPLRTRSALRRPGVTGGCAILQGYVVYSRKQKLRPELVGLPNEEIRDRRLAGEVSD